MRLVRDRSLSQISRQCRLKLSLIRRIVHGAGVRKTVLGGGWVASAPWLGAHAFGCRGWVGGGQRRGTVRTVEGIRRKKRRGKWHRLELSPQPDLLIQFSMQQIQKAFSRNQIFCRAHGSRSYGRTRLSIQSWCLRRFSDKCSFASFPREPVLCLC